MYAVRRIKDGFRMHKSESDQASVEQLIHEAEWNYQVIQRQVRLSQMYRDQMLVLEQPQTCLRSNAPPMIQQHCDSS